VPQAILQERIHTSLDEELEAPTWLCLPGGKNLGLGRHWHFFCLLFWIANGLVYLVGLIITGEWLWLVPTSWAIFPQAWSSFVVYIHLRLAPPLPGQPFNALQRQAYFFIVCLLPPFQIATGLAMSPALAARSPWYIKLFGGRQAARSFHFLSLLVFIGFVIVHTCMVIVHGYGLEVARSAAGG
jgi:sulfoxide reductase catalytic subunit YedY